MGLFFVFLICGLGELWALLVTWGFSAGAANAVPFVTLAGCLGLLFLAAPLALFFRRLAAAIALPGAAAALTWPIGIALDESAIVAAAFAVLPATAMTAAIVRLWRTRHTAWFAVVSKPAMWLRVALTALPVVLFFVLFDVWAVLALLLAGPAPTKDDLTPGPFPSTPLGTGPMREGEKANAVRPYEKRAGTRPAPTKNTPPFKYRDWRLGIRPPFPTQIPRWRSE